MLDHPTSHPANRNRVRNSPGRADTNVGATIRARRKELGLSRAYLAKAAGMTRKELRKYENSTSKIRPSALVEIAEVLKVPLAYFFKNVQHGRGSCDENDFSEDLASLPMGDPALREAAALLLVLNRIQLSPYLPRTLRLLTSIEALLLEIGSPD
ncbi:MAG: helix-turn-helix transcriptional regulator [Acidisphaera sp.]|nr:helix-turn-helix transcriptional regulator [Acidisphaera sp.]